jgi:hypothetical protein
MQLSSMPTLCAYIDGIGLLGPGFDGWPSAIAVLSNTTPYVPQRTSLPAATALPPAEQRRAGSVVKLALAIGFEAVAHAGEKPADLVSVFSSSGADGHNCHEMCEVLATSDRQLSPTRFHNSVHNAAAGYWSIAAGAMTPSNVLSAFDASFAAGLLEALGLVVVNRIKVLLLVYDADYPEPLHAKRPIPDAFGVALVLTPTAGARSLAKLGAELSDAPSARMSDSRLEAMRSSIPAARSLPLLRCLAAREAGRVIVDYLEPTNLTLEVTPCS